MYVHLTDDSDAKGGTIPEEVSNRMMERLFQIAEQLDVLGEEEVSVNAVAGDTVDTQHPRDSKNYKRGQKDEKTDKKGKQTTKKDKKARGKKTEGAAVTATDSKVEDMSVKKAAIEVVVVMRQDEEEKGAQESSNLTKDEQTRRDAAKRMLQDLGFTEAMLVQPAITLSGGYQMRVALALALASQPTLLLLDESTNHLDLQGILGCKHFSCGSRSVCACPSSWFLTTRPFWTQWPQISSMSTKRP